MLYGQIKEQDIEESKDGSPKLRKGVAKDRRIAIEDDQMRHGRKGRSKRFERVTVEHNLAHISQWQGEKARYLELRKNLFDLRSMAIVYNLHVVMRSDF